MKTQTRRETVHVCAKSGEETTDTFREASQQENGYELLVRVGTPKGPFVLIVFSSCGPSHRYRTPKDLLERRGNHRPFWCLHFQRQGVQVSVTGLQKEKF